MEPVPALITVPARACSPEDLEQILHVLVSIRSTAPDAMVLVVDDRSPAAQATLIEAAADELGCAYVFQQDGEGEVAAFNVGLDAARQHGMDAVLVTAGLLFDTTGWLDRLRARTGTDGAPAAIAGGAVLEPGGQVIRQAGYFFSAFRRTWNARLGNAASELLDVQPPLLCPVSLDLLLVRNGWIETAAPLNDTFDLANASLDVCLRVSAAGGECVFEPTVRALAVDERDPEPPERGHAAIGLRQAHSGMSFQAWTPEVI